MEADWGKKLANVACNIIMMIEIVFKNVYYTIYTYGKFFFQHTVSFIRWFPPILPISLFTAPHVNKCLEEI